MIQSTRIRRLADKPVQANAAYVLYWMQQSQRTRHNPALEVAAERANAAGLPLVVCFGVMDDYPEANARHYLFLLQGLRDVQVGLAERGVKFVVRRGTAYDGALHYAKAAPEVVGRCSPVGPVPAAARPSVPPRTFPSAFRPPYPAALPGRPARRHMPTN